MPIFKCTLEFETGSGSGWREVLYRNATSPGEALDRTEIAREIRRNALSNKPSFWIPVIKVAVDGFPRDGGIRTFPYSASRGLFADPGLFAGGAGTPTGQVAANFRVFAGPTLWRSYLLRGIPLGQIDSAGRIIRDNWFRAADVYFAHLVANGWGIRKKIRGAPSQVSALSVVGNHRLSCTTAAAIAGLARRSIVEVSTTDGISRANSLWRVDRVTGASFVTFPKKAKMFGTWTENTGTVEVITYEAVNFTNYEPIRGTSKKTGRPSGVPAGRSRSRAG